MPAFFELDRPPSGTFPQVTESAAERLVRRKKVGMARIRRHKGKYLEVDFSFPAGVKIPRFRKYCRGATEAVAIAYDWSRRIREHGKLVRSLDTAQLWVAAECFRLLSEVAGNDPVALLDVTREYLKLHPKAGRARTLDQVRAELVTWKTKTGRSSRHIAALDYRLRSLVAAIGNKPVTGVTTEDLERELERHPGWNPTTVHSVVQGWKVALNFAIRRGYLVNNPANRLELPKIVHDEPTIFSVDEVRRLMAATLFADVDPLRPACRPYLAIGMFAGLRPEEIERLHWQHVDLDTGTIRVKAANAKDRERRIVELQPNVVQWLRPIARASGPVLAHPLAKLRIAARRILGLAEWPGDIMRHTFVSYHFGEFQNEAFTKKQVGHRDDGRVFYNHYMVPVSRRDARLFWSTIPPVALLAKAAA